ncbi:MAG: hypothetical protein R2844_05275 [Caldilineales bacterium]
MALVIFFLVSLVRRRRSGASVQVGRGDWRFYLALALVAFVLSLGTALRLTIDQPPVFQPLPYTILYNWAPGFKALRTPARIGPLVILSMAVLAGYGAALLTKRARTIVLTALIALMVAEFVAVPARLLPIETGPQVPAVYRWLNNLPTDSVVLELPAVTSRSLWNDAESMARLGRQQYFTTYHWHPTIMGYSGFWPPLFSTDVDHLLAFPSSASLAYLRGRGVNYLVLHQDQYAPAAWDDLQRRLALFGDQLTLLKVLDNDLIYTLQPLQQSAPDLQISAYVPPTAPAGKPYPVYLQVDSPSDAASVHQTQQPYTISYRWQATETGAPNHDSSVVTTMDGVVHGDLPLVHPAGRSYIPVFLPAPPGPDATLEVAIDTLGQQRAATTTVQQSQEAPPLPPGSETAHLLAAGFNYDDKLRLSHVALDSTGYRAGDSIAVTLNWQRLAEDVSDQYVVFFSLTDAGGQEVFKDDRSPADWPGQPETWPPGETVVDRHLLQLPLDLASGVYTLALGLYDVTAQQFVPLMNDDGTQRYAAFETTVNVTP